MLHVRQARDGDGWLITKPNGEIVAQGFDSEVEAQLQSNELEPQYYPPPKPPELADLYARSLGVVLHYSAGPHMPALCGERLGRMIIAPAAVSCKDCIKILRKRK